MPRFIRYLTLSRPHFLLGGALLYAVGAFSVGVRDLATYLIGQAIVTASQLTAHFVNEYADVEADALVVNRTWFSGGSGVLVEGEIAPSMALGAARITTAVAVLIGAGFVFVRPWSAIIGVATLLVSWTYSMPPVRLLSTGWGELATTLVVTVAVPLAGAASQRGSTPLELWIAITALGFVHMAMLLAFELPDRETDLAADKRVLAVRWGKSQTQRAIGLFMTAGFTVPFIAALAGAPSFCWMLVGAVPGLGAIAATRTNRHGLLTTLAVASFAVTAAGALPTFV